MKSRPSITARQLLEEARALSGDFDRLSLAVADRLGLSPTDLLAMDLIAGKGKTSAGELAREMHLTSGAITGLIDRLESAGYARRVSDPNDRRRVLVEATAKEKRVVELFGPLADSLRRAMDRYSERDLAILVEFIQSLRAALSLTTEGIRKGK